MFRRTMALFVRSLREDSRLLKLGALRFGLLAVTLFMLWAAMASRMFIGAPGLYFFGMLVYVNFAFITFAGLGYFSSAITEEKEEGTLGLLRMAGINHIALLLGKALPRLVAALLLLTVQFPFTLLAITLGGVTALQVSAMYVALLAYTTLVACLSLLCSTVFRRTNTASWVTGLVLALFLAAVPYLKFMLEFADQAGKVDLTHPLLVPVKFLLDKAHEASPIRAIYYIWATGFFGSVLSYQVISNLVAAGLMFGLAWAVFDRCVKELPPSGPARPMLSRNRITGRRGRAWSLALVWKDFFFVAGGWVPIVLQLIIYPIVIAAAVRIGNYSAGVRISREFISVTTMGAMWVALGVLPIIFASRVFHNELRWQTFSSLTLLPTSIWRIGYQKIAGCLLGLVPILFYLVIGFAINLQPALRDFVYELKHLGFWSWIAQYLLMVHLVVFLSLIMKSGAVPVTILFMIVILFAVQIVDSYIRMQTNYDRFVEHALLTVGLVGTVALHWGSAVRLRILAAR